MKQKIFVTARDIKTNEHVFIECNDFKSAWNTSGILLKERTYIQIRQRKSKPSMQKYRWINLVKWIGA